MKKLLSVLSIGAALFTSACKTEAVTTQKTKDDDHNKILNELKSLGYMDEEQQKIQTELKSMGYIEDANEQKRIRDELDSLGYLD